MANNKISCSTGKTNLVNPNNFSNSTDPNNISVPVEDLNIYVQLTTYKKGRTVLSASNDITKNESTNSVSISFVEGSKVNGQRYLTTRYTDLTTSFESENNAEALGITSIDIDFNSQIAPMVVINFVDVRGSAIFQNDENITTERNKFATFFSLPYPLYELTIKGYYGKAVKYSLHMTKFSSRFNPANGNFEITATFIGHTYAMLSDMLIGYLKAIPYTQAGKARYTAINSTRDTPILNLNELMIAIGNINTEIKKIAAGEDSTFGINSSNAKLEILDSISNEITSLARSLDLNTGLSTYEYIMFTGEPKETEIKIFNESITKKIKSFNENNQSSQLDVTKFTSFITNMIMNLKADDLVDANSVELVTKLKTTTEKLHDKMSDMRYQIGLRGTNVIVNIFDLTEVNKLVADAKSFFYKEVEDNKIALAEKVKRTIGKRIGFEPTVRNVIEIFTTAIEVFMGSIFDVSQLAKANKDREALLKSKFGDNTIKSSDIKTNGEIYPWPDYREKESKSGWVEKYLGSPDVISQPQRVDELRFIDDLLQGFLTAERENAVADEALNSVEKNWIPNNVFDTRIYQNDFPYNRQQYITKNAVLKTILLRGLIFVYYTNRVITNDEIESFIEYEINSILGNSKIDNITKETLKNVTSTEIDLILSDQTIYQDTTFTEIVNQDRLINIMTVGEYEQFKANQIDTSIDLNIKPLLYSEMSKGSNTNVSTGGGGSVIGAPNGGVTNPVSASTASINPKLNNEVGFSSFAGPYGIEEFKLTTFPSPVNDYQTRFSFYKENDIKGLGVARRLSKYFLENKEGSPYDIVDSSGNPKSTFNIVYDDSTKEEMVEGNFYGNKLFHDDFGKNLDLLKKMDDGVSTSVSFPYLNYETNGLVSNSFFSLFGSPFYYLQTSEYSRAFLFLQTIPWNGTPFNNVKLLNLFAQKGGFVHVPKLWTIYVGALLWRMDTSAPIITDNQQVGGGSGASDPILWKSGNIFVAPKIDSNSKIPKRDKDISILGNTSDLSQLMVNLPESVKNTFKEMFFNFVNIGSSSDGVSWTSISSHLEIWDGSFNDYVIKLKSINSKVKRAGSEHTLNYSEINSLKNLNQYVIVSPIGDGRSFDTDKDVNELGLFLELKYDYNSVTSIKANNAVNGLINAIREEVVIANGGWYIWNNNTSTSGNIFLLPANDFVLDNYKKSVLTRLNNITFSAGQVVSQNEEALFGTSNDNIIKLMLYRTCKNIYDKWIGGSTNGDDITFRTGNGLSSRNSLDANLAQKYSNTNVPRLIDSFRFVTRSFRDIGSELFINPTPVYDTLRSNPNSSAYDGITSLLSSNNFTFNSLPTFINFNDPRVIEDIFGTHQYSDLIGEGISGPSFVCVYIGQSSKHLDFNDSEYPNDGFDIKCNNGEIANLPGDFTIDNGTSEDKVVAFSVDFGQQNQNIFKSVNLDQAEFGETAESLMIVDDITKNGSENNRTFGGQNMYNVYSVRSYKVEVEMMGDAMIQPMMYFQLNSVPMYHGAYMITRVKHNITPNTMTTSFTGVRIREPETKIFNASELYMSLLDSIDTSKIGVSRGSGRQSTYTATGQLREQQGFVDYLVAERPSLVYQEKSKGVLALGDSYAMKEVGQFMEKLADKWLAANINSTTTPNKLYINSFGGYHGENSKKHSKNSSHYVGRAVDLRPMTNGTVSVPTDVNSPKTYNKLATSQFIKMAIDLSNATENVKISQILFNDTDIINQFASSGLVRSYPDHNNHIHIGFTIPPRVQALINQGVYYNSDLVSSGSKGTPIKNLDKYPTDSAKINALGKIKGLSKEDSAILDMIAYGEGTLGVANNGYDVLVGVKRKIAGWVEDSDIPHGNFIWYDSQSDSTAAGRYQFVYRTWLGNDKNLPMSKENQNARALTLMNNRVGNINKSLLATDRNLFITLLNRLSGEWGSFPNSSGTTALKGVNRVTKTIDDYYRIYKLALNKYA